ncbi:hypothetical protein D3C78_1383000 [compost metagenome]
MPQRFAFEMTLQAGHVRFGRHLRHVEAIFRHADRTDPLRQIVHDDPIRALYAFTGIAIFYLLARDVQRVTFCLDFRIGQARIVFQQRELIRHHRVLDDRVLRLRLIFWSRIVVIGRPHIVKVSPQRETKHHGVAALVAEVNVGPIGDAINGTNVKLALLLDLACKVLGVVVALVFQLQA